MSDPPTSDAKPVERGERIAKWLARAGVASRRDAERLIAEKRVRLGNCVVETPASFVRPGDLVTLDGAVPDQASFDRLRQIAAGIYGEGNVVNNLSIDATTTFDDGTLRMVGQALKNDERPKSFQEDVLDAFDLEARHRQPMHERIAIDGDVDEFAQPVFGEFHFVRCPLPLVTATLSASSSPRGDPAGCS